jgi:hypothetical protein
MNAAVVCDGKELETYDVKQEGTSSLTAFIPSEAGKQFKITYSNNLPNSQSAIFLYIDGRLVQSGCLQPVSNGEFLGPHTNVYSILPFKFQELQLVDPDLEDAPIAPEMGVIELKAYRCRVRGVTKPSTQFTHEDLHRGRVSERSKKAGWHHVATGDEIAAKVSFCVDVDYVDPWKGPPYASIKVFYRPRELLRAQGIIPMGRQEFPINNNNNKKRVREDRSPGPSRSRPDVKIKREDHSGDVRAQRIRALQAELDSLMTAEQSDTSVKREVRSPSPIVVGHSGDVVDLTLDD